jgi:hypothetical protein
MIALRIKASAVIDFLNLDWGLCSIVVVMVGMPQFHFQEGKSDESFSQ